MVGRIRARVVRGPVAEVQVVVAVVVEVAPGGAAAVAAVSHAGAVGGRDELPGRRGDLDHLVVARRRVLHVAHGVPGDGIEAVGTVPLGQIEEDGAPVRGIEQFVGPAFGVVVVEVDALQAAEGVLRRKGDLEGQALEEDVDGQHRRDRQAGVLGRHDKTGPARDEHLVVAGADAVVAGEAVGQPVEGEGGLDDPAAALQHAGEGRVVAHLHLVGGGAAGRFVAPDGGRRVALRVGGQRDQGRDVRPGFGDGQALVGGHVEQRLHDARGPDDLDRVGLGGRAQPELDGQGGLRHEPGAAVDLADHGIAAGDATHARADGRGVERFRDQVEVQPVVGGGGGNVVAVQLVGQAGHVAEVDVQVAVLVEVRPAGRGGVGGRADPEAGGRRLVDELPAARAAGAVVAEQQVRHPVVLGIVPVVGQVEVEVAVVVVVRPGAARAVVAVVETVADGRREILEGLGARHAVIEAVGALVGQVEVQPAVAVVVAPGGSQAALGVLDAHGRRHVHEQPLAGIPAVLPVVAEEGVGAAVVVDQVEIMVAVVVVVAPGAAHGVAVVADAGAIEGCHVLEHPLAGQQGILAVVAVEAVGAVVAEVEVQVAVVVVVDPGHRARAAAVVGAGGGADVGEDARAVVAEEMVGRRAAHGHVGLVEVQVAVAVEVAPDGTLPVAVVAHAAGGRVLEQPRVGVAEVLAVVAVEVVRGVRAREPDGPVGDEEVGRAVGVVVAPGDAAAVAVVAHAGTVVRGHVDPVGGRGDHGDVGSRRRRLGVAQEVDGDRVELVLSDAVGHGEHEGARGAHGLEELPGAPVEAVPQLDELHAAAVVGRREVDLEGQRLPRAGHGQRVRRREAVVLDRGRAARPARRQPGAVLRADTVVDVLAIRQACKLVG